MVLYPYIYNNTPVLERVRHVPLRSNTPTRCVSRYGQPRWLSGMRRSHVHSLMIARRSLCPEKLGSNLAQGSKGIKLSGWHGLDMSISVTKRR